MLRCDKYTNKREEMLIELCCIVPINEWRYKSEKVLTNLLLYGSPKLNSDENKKLLENSLKYINDTGRFKNLTIV